MAQAVQTGRAILRPAPVLIVALVGGILVAILVAAAILFVGPGAPTVEAPVTDPAVLDSGRDWEEQRRLQGGYADPLTQSGRDWEEQRRQQGE